MNNISIAEYLIEAGKATAADLALLHEMQLAKADLVVADDFERAHAVRARINEIKARMRPEFVDALEAERLRRVRLARAS